MAYEGVERHVGVELVECPFATQVPRFAHSSPYGDNPGCYEPIELLDGSSTAVVLFAADCQNRTSCGTNFCLGTLEIGNNAST